MPTAREEISTILENDKETNQVDMSAGRLVELIGPVADQFEDLVLLSSHDKVTRVIVDALRLEEVIDALSIYDAGQQDVEPEPDVREGEEID